MLTGCSCLLVQTPETIGLRPDGLEENPFIAQPLTSELAEERSYTLVEARRTGAFWLLNAIFTLTWLVVFMPMVHLVPFATDMGVSAFAAAMTISVIGFAGFVGRLGIGPLSDRCGRIVSLGVCLLLQALSFAGFTISSGAVMLYVSAAVFGFSYGGVTALFPALLGDFFGRAQIGAIVGFIFALAGSPAAFGPLIAGLIYDAAHSYTLAFDLSAALNFTALVLLFFLKRPQELAPQVS
jgi:MFS family permease